MLIQVFSFLGIIVSLYALYLHTKLKQDNKYHAFCDINDQMSCSKVITSRYATIFGIPNPIYGIGFYLFFIVLIYFGFQKFLPVMGILALASTIFLGYEQYFKVRNFCLVCNLIYVINIVLFIYTVILK